MAGWMMGLAWDALWHAFIAPQQNEDKERRARQGECAHLLESMKLDLSVAVPRSKSKVSPSRPPFLPRTLD